LQKFDIKEWVNQNSDYRTFRQAVHTILIAIAGTPFLQTSMIMKGGVLLALSYSSPRYTKDIDFSTATKRSSFDIDDFRQQLEASLLDTVETLEYGLDCRVQSCTQHPKNEDATFPAIKVSIGYAYKGSPAHKRLQAGNATTVIRIDYSLNEPVEETELFELEEGNVIHTYSLVEMVAEKFRALLQQEVRNRFRRQDIYDLHYVLSDHPLRDDPHTKARILERLIEKSRIRDLPVDPNAMSNPEIRRRSEAEYNKLAPEIEGDLPPFGEVYDLVEAFYRALPW
jgi:predicted nucleotidyltransferase component of viral defense system